MGTKILDSGHLACVPAVKNHLLTTDLTAQRLVGNFIGSAGDVPRVFWVYENPPGQRLFLFLMDPLRGRRLLQVNLG